MSVVRNHAVKQGASRMRGFTLIELMVVVAIVAILVSIALPSYNDAVRKGRRGQAKSDLVELAQRAERFRTVNNTYLGFALTAGIDDRSPRVGNTAFYAVALENQAAGTFTLRATPQNGQEADTLCGELTIDQAGVKTESGTGSLSDCW